jgi:hypothetical protein
LTAPLILVDGDQVQVGYSPAGVASAVVLPAAGTGPATSLAKLRIGGRGFVIPMKAVPFLGHGLDLSLFDVAALKRAEKDGRMPVTLRYRGRLRAVPGINVSHTALGAAEGYLTPASAARLGAALARSSGSGGMFDDGLSVALAGSAAARVRRDVPTRTVTVTGTNLAGKPANGGLVLVSDVRDTNLPTDPLATFRNGKATFTGPPGTYWALAVFPQLSARGNTLSERMDVLPQFKVTGNTTVHLRARAATSKVTLVTPRPAIDQSTTLTLVRAAPHAPANPLSSLLQSFAFTDNVPLWVNPVSRAPRYGTLRVFTSGQLTSPRKQPVPYAYTLNFADAAGTIPPQHFVATPANLAVVSERYVQDRHSVASWITLGGTPYQLDTSFIGATAFPLSLPTRQVQYISASPAMLWRSSYSAYGTISAGQTPGGQNSAFRLLRPRQQLTQVWGQYPLHPGFNVSFPGTPNIFVQSSADRVGNTLNLDVTPFSDNQFGDTGDGFDVPFPASANDVSGSYAIYQNGVKIAGGAPVPGAAEFLASAALSPRPALIKFVLTASRASTQYQLSAASRDVWTWHSRREPRATVPAPWLCGFAAVLERHCAVQPLITLDYQVAGLGLDGATGPGRQTIAVTAGHVQLAPAFRVIRMQVQVSVNGGKTWRQAHVRSAGADRFNVTFSAPRSAQLSLRVTARDAAGNSLSETILRAYRTASRVR